jgi:outer membrane PBP1 activator LpoA protein
LSDASPISGVTGKLRLDAEGRIRRDLDWAQIKNGQPVEL